MGDTSLEQVGMALRMPRNIYAPDGTRVNLLVKVNEDAMSVGQLNRPGYSGGSPAWERGWNHGQETGWTDEVSV